MNKLLLGAATIILTSGIGHTHAVELLTGGDFEDAPVEGIQGWDLEEFATGSTTFVDSAELKPWDPDTSPNDLWLRSFEGGGPLLAANGNFDLDGLPAGDVDGNDLLEWQRGNSPAPHSPEDLALWKTNFGKVGGLLTNAILAQTVPGVAGESYTFKGSSRWETNYSGGVTTLDAGGPLGAVASPTTTTMELAFLDTSGSVIDSPTTLDLLADGQSNFNFWMEHTLNGVAPAGTASVRVTAEARDMVWNGVAEEGLNQTAFYDSFTLTGAGAPATELLSNPALDDAEPSLPAPWTVTTDPPDDDDIMVTEGFANRPASGGDTGVFLKPFQGNPTPVDGTFAQTVPAVAGGTYELTGWSKWEQNYSGGVATLDPSSPFGAVDSPTETLMELAFLDGSDAVIDTPIVLDLKADRIAQSPTSNANDGEWYGHTLGGVAPVGAVSVRVSGMMVDGVFNVDPFQAAFFDDFSLDGPAELMAASAVPEPASVVSLALGLALLGLAKFRRLSRAST
jgi:PEP-CTERM motif-containing protein